MFVYTDLWEEELFWELEHRQGKGMMIKVFPFDVTERICRDIKDLDIVCDVVSIYDEELVPPQIEDGGAVRSVFRMHFPDIDDCDASYLMKYAATAEDLAGLKDFIDEIKDDCDLLLVHCVAGISRSPAVASAIEEYLGFEDTIWSSGRYNPNRHVYRLALQEFGLSKTEAEMDALYDDLNRHFEEQEEDEDLYS